MINKKDLELTLLSLDNISNKTGLDCFKSIGGTSDSTDLTLLLGDNKNGYFTSSKYPNERMMVYVAGLSIIVQHKQYYRKFSIRPVLNASDSYEQITLNKKTKYIYGVPVVVVEFGEYPQSVAPNDIQSVLEKEFNFNKLKLTGNYYTFDGTKVTDYTTEFSPLKYEEYMYLGKKYIRIKANVGYRGKRGFSNNGWYGGDGDYVWVEVSPVVWILDDKSKSLISEKELVSGIRFHNDREDYDGNFARTEMKEYLDTYMFHDLFQSVNFTRKVERSVIENSDFNELSNGNKIVLLYKEIQNLVVDYFGERDYVSEAKELIEKYNTSIDKIYNKSIVLNSDKPNAFNLTTDVLDENMLFSDTQLKLNKMIDELREYHHNYEVYVDMLDYIENNIKILDDKNYNKSKDSNEVFNNDLTIIRDTVIPYIEDDSILKNIKEMLIDYKNNIKNYLRGINSDISNIKTLEELKKDIATKMTHYLMDLNYKVRSKDIFKDIIEGYKNLSETIKRKNRNKHIMFWFDQIDELIDKIKEVGDSEDKKQLSEILKSDNLIVDDVNISVSNVYELYRKIYMILLNIEYKNDAEKKRNESKAII